MTAIALPAVPIQPVSTWVIATADSGTVVIAGGAFWLSFTTLTHLAQLAGIHSSQSWVWPLIVDGLIVVATVAAVALNPYGWKAAWYPWMLLFGGTLISVAANATHAILTAPPTFPTVVAAVISSVPPLMLLATTHLTVELTSRARRASPADVPSLAGGIGDSETEAASDSAPQQFEAVQLRQLGWSNRRIARALQVHPSTVGRWLNRGDYDDPTSSDPRHGMEPTDGRHL